MDDKKLSAFLEAVHSGSLSRAASGLGYTQSGLTQMMNSLEDELGCALLVRSYNGVRLTPTGEQLLPFIEDAASSLKRLRDEARQSAAGQSKPIRIGVFPSLSKSWLPYILKEFQRRSPGTTVKIAVGGYEIPGWLDNDAVDLALIEESMKGNYRWIPLGEDVYYAVVPRDCKLAARSELTLDDLSPYPFILSEISELKAQLRPLLMKGRMHEDIQINSVDDAALLSLVEQGLGVTVLPELALKDCSNLVTVLPLAPPMKRTVGIVMPRSTRSQVGEFVDFIKNLKLPSGEARLK